MHKHLRFSFLAFIISFSAAAQSDIKHRVILIGDAGEMNEGQRHALKSAAQLVLTGKTTTLFLGDNIYPTGMELPGTEKHLATAEILKSQFEPMRAKGSATYFVPGNHDWDKSGPLGLAKIQAQSDFLAAYNDPKLQLLPQSGCPNPVAIELTDKLTVIAYDSEWWLFPYDKNNPDCECNTKEEVIMRMRELLNQHKDKMIILASHHPFQSYGVHGGYFSLKDHLFPLTAVSKNFYLPMPVIGSLYPFLRTTFLNPEDMKHPLYKDMISKVNSVFGNLPNVVYAAGHEHGLQLIKGNQLQIVSGAGAKQSANKKGKNALFHSFDNGFVVADQLQNNNMRYTYYIYQKDELKQAYTHEQAFVETPKEQHVKAKKITSDTIIVQIKPSFDSVGKFHRYFFGDNYRKDYAMPVKLPVIKISEIKGGLKPTQLGGGNQSKSLRLVDKQGNEYALRSVEKYPEVLLPKELRETFAKDVIQDNMASQHPFSALIVPPLAKVAKVPHANPIIGYVSPDDDLGDYSYIFANTVCLLEERNPLGKSDNTTKMLKKLDKENDNTYDAKTYLRAKLLDILIGDWDRHEDQWRWKADSTKKGIEYIAVPRDRDQVMFRTDGFIQRYAQTSSLLPMMQGIERNLKDINWFLWEGRAMNSKILSEYNEDQWNKEVLKFCSLYTDDVLEDAVKRLPPESYAIWGNTFVTELKNRLASMPEMMKKYYKFFNRIVDIQASQKNEKVTLTSDSTGNLKVVVHKINKSGNVKDKLFENTFDPKITKEIRLYLRAGADSVIINNTNAPIKIKVIAGHGKKVYDVVAAPKKIKLFGLLDTNIFIGNRAKMIAKKLSTDTANATYLGKDLYVRNTLNPAVGFNTDDGILLGASFKVTNPGFRKQPYGNSQFFQFKYAFATSAFRFKYSGDWLNALGKADILIQANVHAPDNTNNFFGLGNETTNERKIAYYRSRFDLLQLNAFARWRRPKATITLGPSVQYYSYNPKDNLGKLISNSALLHSPDSLVVDKNKLYAGAILNFVNNTRDRELLPTLGSYIDLKLLAYQGVTKDAHAFAQFRGSVALYKNLDGRANFILANRFGGTTTVGKPAFFQHAYLGGEDNLLGYRQYRFAGQHSLYNNMEMRIRLGDFVSYILPGQVGLLGLWDTGRVWLKDEKSKTWHHGVGAGLYFAPASLTLLQAVAAYSKEGWYPSFSFNYRF